MNNYIIESSRHGEHLQRKDSASIVLYFGTRSISPSNILLYERKLVLETTVCDIIVVILETSSMAFVIHILDCQKFQPGTEPEGCIDTTNLSAYIS